MLIVITLFGVHDKVQTAIDRLRLYEPPDGYYVAFSGGKDSQTIYHLCKEAGVKFDAHYHLTTVDPPELVTFIRKQYPDVAIDRPRLTMWQLIVKKGMPPTRLVRYCCDKLKENGGQRRFVVTGVRWEESAKRKNSRAMLEINIHSKDKIMLNNDNADNRRLVETCITKGKHILNPIIDWTEDDVWEYLNSRKIPHCRLYDEGFKRLGCIGCPMSGTKGMLKEFERWPKYKQIYLHAFERMIQARADNGKPYTHWKTADDVMNWWIYGNPKETIDENQLKLWEMMTTDED